MPAAIETWTAGFNGRETLKGWETSVAGRQGRLGYYHRQVRGGLELCQLIRIQCLYYLIHVRLGLLNIQTQQL